MKHIAPTLAAVFLAGVTAFAQTPPYNRPAAGETLSAAGSLQREYGLLKANLIFTAEVMPDAGYDFRPSPDMRSFGELLGHAANSQFNECAHLIGASNPNQGINHEKSRAKSDLVNALAASFAFCDGAFSPLTQESMLRLIHMGAGNMTRLGYTVHMLAHGAEVNGLATVYLRMKGLTPRLTEEGMGSRRPELVAACANTWVSGTVTHTNPVTGEMGVRTPANTTLNLRADINTVFHIPNARPEDLRPAALAKSLPDATVEVNYCTTELWVREVKVQR